MKDLINKKNSTKKPTFWVGKGVIPKGVTIGYWTDSGKEIFFYFQRSRYKSVYSKKKLNELCRVISGQELALLI